jgi:hypothetical protein
LKIDDIYSFSNSLYWKINLRVFELFLSPNPIRIENITTVISYKMSHEFHVVWRHIIFRAHHGGIVVDGVLFEFNGDGGQVVQRFDGFGWKKEPGWVNRDWEAVSGDEGKVGKCRNGADYLWNKICNDGGYWYKTYDLMRRNCWHFVNWALDKLEVTECETRWA